MNNSKTKYWEGEKNNIQRMFFSPRGATLQDVADRYGVSRQRIYQVVEQLSIQTLSRSEARCISIERMLHQGKSELQIAQSLGIPRKMVRNYIRRFRIKYFSIKQKIQKYLQEEKDERLDWLYNNIKRKRRVTDAERFEMLLNLELPKYCPVTFIEIDYKPDGKKGYRKNKPALYKFRPSGRNNLNNCAVLSHLGTRVPRHGSFDDMDLFNEWVEEERAKRRDARN